MRIGEAHLLSPVDELYGDLLARAFVERKLHKTKGPAIHVPYLHSRGTVFITLTIAARHSRGNVHCFDVKVAVNLAVRS